VLSALYDFSSPILAKIAAVILVVLAIKLFMEKVHPDKEQHGHFHNNACNLTHVQEHEHAEGGFYNEHLHPKRLNMPLRKLASCAFVLVFMRRSLPRWFWLWAVLARCC
jgi:ABC-type nickel/cobalt efflux system permease component RcnA